MGLWGLIGSCVAMIAMAYFLFMVGAIVGSSYANGRNLSPRLIRILDLFIFILPGSACLAFIMLIVGYKSDWGVHSYWWCALPCLATISYFLFIKWNIR